MNVANRRLIEDAVLLIEDNLKTGLSLDEIAERLCISKFHLHRIFRAITGSPLITYVRGRRLTSSLSELLDTQLKIIDIAYEYNFEYEQSYERAFRQLFGLTPSAFRLQSYELPIIPRLDTSLLNDLTKGILVPPRYLTKSRFYIAGIKTLINHKENYDTANAASYAQDFYYNRRFELNNIIKEHIYYGLITYYDFETANYYMPGVEVSIPFMNDPVFTCQAIENSEYAVFRYIGLHSPEELNYKLLSEIYDAIDNLWFPFTSLKPTGHYHFERIDLNVCRKNYCEADIYFPVDITGKA